MKRNAAWGALIFMVLLLISYNSSRMRGTTSTGLGSVETKASVASKGVVNLSGGGRIMTATAQQGSSQCVSTYKVPPDTSTAQCQDFCKESFKKFHCRWCKCRACDFCPKGGEAIEEASNDAPPASPAVEASFVHQDLEPSPPKPPPSPPPSPGVPSQPPSPGVPSPSPSDGITLADSKVEKGVNATLAAELPSERIESFPEADTAASKVAAVEATNASATVEVKNNTTAVISTVISSPDSQPATMGAEGTTTAGTATTDVATAAAVIAEVTTTMAATTAPTTAATGGVVDMDQAQHIAAAGEQLQAQAQALEQQTGQAEQVTTVSVESDRVPTDIDETEQSLDELDDRKSDGTSKELDGSIA